MTDRSKRLTDVSRNQSYDNVRPRDAATLVIIDNCKGKNLVLMGRRRSDLAFLPGKYVFPGGRVAPEDRFIKTLDELAEPETEKLLFDMKGRQSRLRTRALALAAVRETYEETGILVGRQCKTGIPATKSPIWQSFFSEGVMPDLRSLSFVARAITPPKRPRRYDTRFFCVSQRNIAGQTELRDGELDNLDWISIDNAMELDVPMITRVVLEELSDLLKDNGQIMKSKPIPYYYMKNGSFKRELISVISTP